MRFGFLIKRGKPEARDLAAELIQSLVARGNAALVCDAEARGIPGAEMVPEAILGASIDALVVLGGDGTFLYGAGLVAGRAIPLFGVNLGSLGFITHFQRGEALAALQAVCDGQVAIDERMRLAVTVTSAEGKRVLERRSAVNDAVISQPAMARLLDLEARLENEIITTYKADGLILATPTGSTAYNLAAAGPILPPALEAIVLTPICPHTMTNRPLVVRADRRLVIRNVSSSAAQQTVDGQWGCAVAPGESVEVRKEAVPLRLYRGTGSFFSILREKLSWGERRA